MGCSENGDGAASGSNSELNRHAVYLGSLEYKDTPSRTRSAASFAASRQIRVYYRIAIPQFPTEGNCNPPVIFQDVVPFFKGRPAVAVGAV